MSEKLTVENPQRLAPIGAPETALQSSRQRFELQLASRMHELLKRGADCRRIKVKRVKQSVREDQFMNDLKLHVAAERLIDRLEAEAVRERRL